MREEIQRLKGGRGQPPLLPNPLPSGSTIASHSSEKERHQPKPRHKRSKLEQIEVSREEVLRVDPAQLPPDAEFKGYETVVQDVKRLRWADALSFGPDGWLYVADSAIPDQMFHSKSHMRAQAPYRIFRFKPGTEGVPGQ